MSNVADFDDPSGPEPPSPIRTALEAAAFGCELAMLVVLGIAGWGIGNGGLMSIALTAFYPALAILLWSIWMAPRSGRRLADPTRLVVQLVLFAATGALAAAGGHPLLGIVFGVIAAAVFVGTRVTGEQTGR